ncbi:MAG: hypothetical protein ACRC6O_10390, partial [Flavobacterium sp.]
MNLKLDPLVTKELPYDKVNSNNPRQVEAACFSFVTPKKPSNPQLLHTIDEVVEQIGLTLEDTAG